jgi:hypothetical protein
MSIVTLSRRGSDGRSERFENAVWAPLCDPPAPPEGRPWRILSLGAGVQSTTVLAMSCLGVLDRIDAAIFADTGWEPPAVYAHLDWCEEFAAGYGIPIYRCGKGNIRADAKKAYVRNYDASKGERWANLPYYVRNADTNEVGILRRQCTKEYKVQPLDRLARRIMGYPGRERIPSRICEHWFGISGDESQRVRLPKQAWKTHRYPLVYEVFFQRIDCLRWLKERGLPTPPRSACIGCPFRSNEEWQQIKDDPAMWADACEFDAMIRDRGGMRGKLYLHRDGVPLWEADLHRKPFPTKSQLSFGIGLSQECEGHCGV